MSKKNPPPMLIWDPTAISFYENSHPLRLFGTLRQLGTPEYRTISGRSRLVAAPLRNHAKRQFL